MLFVPPPLIIPASGVVIANTDEFDSSSSNTTYTFNSLAFGAVHATREIFVLGRATHNSGPARDVASATIGGVTATVCQDPDSGATGGLHFLLHAFVPTGTTGTVAITFSDAMGSGASPACQGSVFRVINRSPVNTTMVNTYAKVGGTATTTGAQVTPTIPNGGFAFSIHHVSGGPSITVSADFNTIKNQHQTVMASCTGAVPGGGTKSYTGTWSGSAVWLQDFYVFKP